MKTAILSVGTELLLGQTADTNAAFLSRQLNLLGFDVLYRHTVGDNGERLGRMIRDIFEECDYIIATGGLGPTEDDLTKETFSEVLHDTLTEHGPSMERLKEMEKLRSRKLTENNFKQAMMPARAVVFPNSLGTAPGFALTENGKTAVCMPGPPREMENMWFEQVRPYLEKLQNSVLYYKTPRFFGIGESLLETKLLDLIDMQTDPTVATYAGEGECSVRVASKRRTLKDAKKAVDDMIEKIRERVGAFMYSTDGESLAEVVGKKLIERNISLSSCESCTGGMFAEAITGVPGISQVFERGIVTYSEKAKMEELDVKKETLEKFTAVSRETALEMVRGLQKKTGSRVCVSATGYAGPSGGQTRPAGNIFTAVRFDHSEKVREISTGRSDRNWNRKYAVLSMLDMINKILGQ